MQGTLKRFVGSARASDEGIYRCLGPGAVVLWDAHLSGDAPRISAQMPPESEGAIEVRNFESNMHGKRRRATECEENKSNPYLSCDYLRTGQSRGKW